MSLFIAVFAVYLFGLIVQTVTGFGFGIIAMAILPVLVPYTDALVAVGMISAVHSIFLAVKHRKDIQWKILISPLLGYMVFSVVTTHFVKMQSNDSMKRLLGVFLVLLAGYMILSRNSFHINANPVTGTIAGSTGGILHAAFGMGGPPMVVYLLSATESPIVYLSSIQAYFALTTIYLCGIRAWQGMFTVDVFPLAALGIAAIPVGIWMGEKIFLRFRTETLRIMVYGFMGIMGAYFAIG